MLCRAAVALCFALPGAAFAAPATPEEATRLTALFETYVGHPAPGAQPSVTVTPAGDSYKVALDLARMAAPLHDFGIDVVATSPYTATLTPLSDGTWRVQRAGFPQFGFTTKKGLTYSVQFLSPGSDAIFDPKIQSFSHQEIQLAGNKSSMTSETKDQQHTELTEQGKQVIDAKGTDPGDVSTTFRQEDKTIRYTAHVDPPTKGVGASPVGDMSLTIASALSEASIAHGRVGALLDLWAFLAAHPTRDKIVAEQPKLKSLLLATIPFAASFAGHAGGEDVAAQFGQIASAKAGSLSEAIAYDSGNTTEGLALSFKMSDVEVSTPLAPPWILAALPRRLELNLATSPLDVGKALRVLVEEADLSKDEPLPPKAMALAIAALAPNGGPTLAVKPSMLANRSMSLAFLGAFSSAGLGKARIEAKGLDQEIAAISGAATDDPLAGQAVQILSVARALAVAQSDGRLLWEIVNDANGLSVNGKPLQ